MPDFRITIDLRDVGPGDVDDLAEQIADEHGDTFDAEQGDFVVRVQQKVGESFYGRDRGDDVIE